ncbi:glycosyltransferase family 9 protein [Larkinella terrae]|uniref:Glycosyltransferase family 9 protein n=1 Tax=Larkinella terrae TaxID=2025311 RepID=A0A7K0ER78_9BACT|nr:glycosyltransferase family 9 protein [Larkinella terrae]MRS64325.1 glycosyltransferase family 9 protein [Larkinella terrae]
MNKPHRFLIVQTAFIGDVILATSLVEKLHFHFPDATIDLLLRKGNEGLLKNHPYLNEVLIWDKKKNKYRDLLRLIRIIRPRRYDKIINLQRFGATGLLTALSGAVETIGFDKNPFSRFFTRRVEHRIAPDIHEIDRNTELVSWFTNRSALKPRLYPSTEDINRVKPYQNKSYLCIAPTSVWFTKQYPEEKWVEFLRQLPDHLTVYMLGAPADSNAIDRIRQNVNSKRVVNLAGQLSFLESAALMKGAQMNFVNDSAPMHLASAVNAPTTAIFCSTIPQFGFGPLADESHLVEIEEILECRPCGLHGRPECPLGHFQCAYGIRTQQLMEKLP